MSTPSVKCKVKGCGSSARARGMCNKHYLRWQKYGDPDFVKVVFDRSLIAPGERFGRIVVLALLEKRRDGKRVYRCECDCGNVKEMTGRSLRGGTRSCGCWNPGNTRHGHAPARGPNHPLYTTWLRMRERCLTPSCPSFPDYGARGITIDPRWDDFAQFLADIGPKPSRLHSLDRIDNNGPYSPENCRWATPQQQSRNRRCCYRNEIVALLGQVNGTLAPREIASALGISAAALYGPLGHMARAGEIVREQRRYRLP